MNAFKILKIFPFLLARGRYIYIYIEIEIDIYVMLCVDSIHIFTFLQNLSYLGTARVRVREKERIAFRVLTRSGVGPLAGWRRE